MAARARFLESIRTQSAYTHEFRMRRYDGEYRWVVSRAVPRFSSQGIFLGFAGAVLDITPSRLAEQKLHEANSSLATQLAESTIKEQELRELSARLIDAQEEERKRLARELHDDLSQQIAALSISTGNPKRQIPEDRVEARALSDRLHGKLVQLAGAVRRMSHELHPAILEYSGLAAALRSYCEEFGTLTGIQVSLDIQGSFHDCWPSVKASWYRTPAPSGIRSSRESACQDVTAGPQRFIVCRPGVRTAWAAFFEDCTIFVLHGIRGKKCDHPDFG
ncbi:MAG: histidine kinase [Bryobacteraceae bacterium]